MHCTLLRHLIYICFFTLYIAKVKEKSTSISPRLAMSSFGLLQQTLIVVGASVALPFGALWFACSSTDKCVESGACVRVSLESSKYLPQCNYKLVPSLVGSMQYIRDFDTNTSTTLENALRAYCSPGERIQSFTDTDHSSTSPSNAEMCTPQYSYPNSINTEIQEPSGDSPSDRMCGAWIRAGSVSNPFAASYWSFSGVDREVDAVKEASLAAVSSSLSRTNIGKMAEKCEHTLHAGDAAMLSSAKDAYQHLLSEANIESVLDANSALRALGVIAGHHCDSPVSIGWTYASGESIGAFSATMYSGSRFSDTAIGEALQMVGEESQVIEKAVFANARINSEASAVLGYPSLATLERVYEGASGRMDHNNVSLVYGYAEELSAFDIVSRSDVEASKHYLKGLVATCSFVVSASLNYVGYAALPSWSASARELKERQTAKKRISALGRLSAERYRTDTSGFEPMHEIDNGTMHNATSATFSQLIRTRFDNSEDQCSSYVTALFPDTLDHERFLTIYTGELYQKLESVTQRIRAGVATVLREDERIRRVLSDADQVASDVEKVRLRIPGAPRGTWAGADRNLPFAFFDSRDSFFKMVLKQARSVFLDRQATLVYEATDVCEGPSVMDSLTSNAYIYPNVHCSYYLLGLSLRPFLDPSFDEESILSRFGYVVAHEFAHSTLNTEWITSELEKLLHRYQPNTLSEAIADIVGGLGLIRSNKDSAYQLNATKLCDHVVQTWCARVGMLYYATGGGVHPKANRRGDYFCDTILVDLDAGEDARL